jgi:hypothetical protein
MMSLHHTGVTGQTVIGEPTNCFWTHEHSISIACHMQLISSSCSRTCMHMAMCIYIYIAWLMSFSMTCMYWMPVSRHPSLTLSVWGGGGACVYVYWGVWLSLTAQSSANIIMPQLTASLLLTLQNARILQCYQMDSGLLLVPATQQWCLAPAALGCVMRAGLALQCCPALPATLQSLAAAQQHVSGSLGFHVYYLVVAVSCVQVRS